MNCTKLLAALLAVGLPLAAQAPIERVVSLASTAVSAQRVAAPKERLPRTATLQATAKMAYAVWQEGTGTTAPGAIYFSSTSDGGVSWNTKVLYNLVQTGVTTIAPLNSLNVVASGYSVFVCFLSNQKNPTINRNDAYVIASSDEGATFSAPTLVNTVTTAAPIGNAQLLMCAAGTYQGTPRCYVVYEHSPVNTSYEGAYFAAVQVVGTTIVPVVPELLINTLAPPGTNDIDDIAVGCDGGTVCVAWRDDRGNAAGSNDMHAEVSTVGGSDFGTASAPDQKISLNAGLGFIEIPVIAVSGPNCYVYWLDNRNHMPTATNGNDDAFLAVSNNSGTSWTEINLVVGLSHPVDIDGGSVVADGQTVIIALEDDSLGRALVPPTTNFNNCDAATLYVSKNAGGTWTSTYISTPPTTANNVRCEQPEVAMSGDYVHVCWEESWYNTTTAADEDVYMGKSFDGGLTWTTSIAATKRGSSARGMTSGGGDIDNPTICVTGNGEGVVGILSKPLLSQPTVIYVHMITRGGLEVSSKFMGATGLEIRDCPKSQGGKLGFVMLTFDPNPVPFYLPSIFGNDGFEPNLVFDTATNVGLQLLSILSGTIPANGGTLSLPAVPDLSGTVNIVGVTVDLVSFKWMSFSPRGRL